MKLERHAANGSQKTGMLLPSIRSILLLLFQVPELFLSYSGMGGRMPDFSIYSPSSFKRRSSGKTSVDEETSDGSWSHVAVVVK